MLYQRSLDIERRLETVLALIRSGDYSTPMIARQLHVSIPTASRYVTALRERGHNISAQRRGGSWRYVIAHKIGRAHGDGKLDRAKVAHG